MAGRLLSIGGKGIDGLIRSHGRVVIPPNHARTVRPYEFDALGRVGVVPDDVAQTIYRVDLGALDGLKGALKGFQIRVNVGEEG